MPDETGYLNHLLTEAKQGNLSALDELCQALRERLRVVIQSYLWGWSRPDQEDVLQSTLMVFSEKYNNIEDNPHHFALQVMRNKVGDAIRHIKAEKSAMGARVGVSESEFGPAGTGPAGQTDPESEYGSRLDAMAELGRIRSAVIRLPRFCRLLFVGMLEGQDVNEVWNAARLAEPSLTRSAFDKRVFVCRRRLRAAIGADR